MALLLDKNVTTTYQPKALDFANDRPAVFRTGADIGLPAHLEDGRFYRLFGSAKPKKPSWVAAVPASPWLNSVLETIASYRSAQNGWDGGNAHAPSQKALDAAEMFAVLASSYVRSEHLTFSVDYLGRPTFAGRSSNFYLHLTLDDGDHMTWLAENLGVESFDESVEFTGRQIPDGLLQLLT
jgi:hypothetical protein